MSNDTPTSITAITPVNVAISPASILAFYQGAMMSKEDTIKALSTLGMNNLEILERMEEVEPKREKNVIDFGINPNVIRVNAVEGHGLTLFRVYTSHSSQEYAI